MAYINDKYLKDTVKKVGRNDPCPCGSGLKYKKCCLGKTEKQKRFEDFLKSTKEAKKKAREKECLYPDHTNCSGSIVKAHAIQNNRVLKKLAENGEVITNDGISNIFFQDTQRKGRKIATTFTGFCSFHDKTVFQDIEDNAFSGTQKQVFLYTYRTMAWHYQKKREQVNRINLTLQGMKEKGYSLDDNPNKEKVLSPFFAGIKDNDEEKEIFDNAIMTSSYDAVSYRIWEIPYEVSFAVSMMDEIEYDIDGNQINDLSKPERPVNAYLNIFPDDKKSFCIWSWLKEWDSVMKKYTDQFMNLSNADKENYLNNKLPLWSDSIIISPRLVDYWGEDVHQSFVTHSNFDFLISGYEREREKEERAFQYMETPWNLFENIATTTADTDSSGRVAAAKIERA